MLLHFCLGHAPKLMVDAKGTKTTDWLVDWPTATRLRSACDRGVRNGLHLALGAETETVHQSLQAVGWQGRVICLCSRFSQALPNGASRALIFDTLVPVCLPPETWPKLTTFRTCMLSSTTGAAATKNLYFVEV